MDIINDTVNIFISKLTLANIIKYIIEGLVIAIVAYAIPSRRTNIKELVIIGGIAAASFFLLDAFTPDISKGSRLGVGFGTGMNLVRAGALAL